MTKRNSPALVEFERHRIHHFILDEVISDESAKPIPIAAIFDGFQTWLKKRKLPTTSITVDAFGQIFPKHFVRKTIYWDGGTCRAVVGVRLA